ncbi:TPA: hypothetical protein ACPE2G_000456 [Citrobacter braakii]|nr:hypothetical protein [Citrobacter freundii]
MVHLIFILLSIWLCRQNEERCWLSVRFNISLLMLQSEHPARSKGLR